MQSKNRGTHSLINDGIYYEDEEYGSIRILSAASAFPCGTIIEVDNGNGEPFYGVVLDRGGSMNSAWKNGTVWIDLAYASSADAKVGGITGTNIKFDVQRWGFQKSFLLSIWSFLLKRESYNIIEYRKKE